MPAIVARLAQHIADLTDQRMTWDVQRIAGDDTPAMRWDAANIEAIETAEELILLSRPADPLEAVLVVMVVRSAIERLRYASDAEPREAWYALLDAALENALRVLAPPDHPLIQRLRVGVYPDFARHHPKEAASA